MYDEALNLSGFLTTEVSTETGKLGVQYPNENHRLLSRTTGVSRDAQSLLPVEYWSTAKATMDKALEQFNNECLAQLPKTSSSHSASVFVTPSGTHDSDSCSDDGDIDPIDYIPLHDLIHNPKASRSPCQAPPAHLPTRDIYDIFDITRRTLTSKKEAKKAKKAIRKALSLKPVTLGDTVLVTLPDGTVALGVVTDTRLANTAFFLCTFHLWKNLYIHIRPLFRGPDKFQTAWSLIANTWWDLCKYSDIRLQAKWPRIWRDFVDYILAEANLVPGDTKDDAKREHARLWLMKMGRQAHRWAACFTSAVFTQGANASVRAEVYKQAYT